LAAPSGVYQYEFVDIEDEENDNNSFVIENNLLKISNKYKIPMSFFVGRLAKLRKITYSSELYNKYKLQ